MADQVFPVPPAAVVLVDRDGSYRVWGLHSQETVTQVRDLLGEPVESGPAEKLNEAVEMLEAVTYFRTTQRVQFKVNRDAG